MKGARILEDAGRTLLVQADESVLRSLFSDESLWAVGPEMTYQTPDPHPKIGKPPR